jgi:hypothetical protein
MPEIKNTFLQGKMNKDLDERLIPNGQYRDAMNVEVATAEDSDIGTVKNILGNHRVEELVGVGFTCVGSIADEKTNKLYWFISSYEKDVILEYDSVNDITLPVVVDLNAGNFKAVLKFSGNIITGINIIDNLLFWTDNNSEPKKINIDTCKAGTDPSGDIHTQLEFKNGSFNGITTQLVSAIPVLNSNFTTYNDYGRYFWAEQKQLEQLFPKEIIDSATGSVIPFAYGTNEFNAENPYNIRHYRNGKFLGVRQVKVEGVNSGTGATSPFGNSVRIEDGAIQIGDVVFGNNISIDIEERHITVIRPKPLNAPSVKINHSESTGGTNKIPNLFETKFPRFSYRYKFNDGEYSVFAPFTAPVFNPKYKIDKNLSVDANVFYNKDNAYDVKEPHNKAMVNSIHSVELTDFISAKTPEDAVEIEILYKQEESSVIYSIGTIKHVDPEWHATSNHEDVGVDIGLGKSSNVRGFQAEGGYTKGRYTITTENIYAALPANQLLRPWDNVPKKALAQEITGNRIVYGNYVQNYYLNDNVEVQVGYSERKNSFSNFDTQGLPSIKSQRNYQLGVVYCDKYGRETPVFTSDYAALTVPWQDADGMKNASKSLQLHVSTPVSFPEWVDSLKFFIKENSGEYYNLLMERAWVTKSTYELDNSEGHMWLCFPSSDRNKISEEDYIILKKKIGTGEEQIPFENKFKVIDIKNEAPDAIKYQLVNYGVATNHTNDRFTQTVSTQEPLFPDPNARIDYWSPNKQFGGTSEIVINKSFWLNFQERRMPLHLQEGDDGGSTKKPIQDDLYISWFRGKDDGADDYAMSKRYKVLGGWVGTEGYVLRLSTPIAKIDADIAHVNGDSSITESDVYQDLLFQVEKRILKDEEDFSGKFFVKISKNQVTDLIESGKPVSVIDKFQVKSKTSLWYWQDDIAGTSPGVLNYQVGSSGYGLTNYNGETITYTSPINSLHYVNATDMNNGWGDTAGDGTDTRADGEMRVTDFVTPWKNMRDDTYGPTFFVDSMHMAAGQSEASNYAKYCCVTWSGATAGDDSSAENSSWSYPPLKTWLSDFDNITNLISERPKKDKIVGAGLKDIISVVRNKNYSPNQMWVDNNLISTSPGLPSNPDFDDLKVDGWVGPLQNVSRNAPPTVLSLLKNHVNGLEGLVTTVEDHSKGPRRWFSGITGSKTEHGVGTDTETYANDHNDTGRHFMHLSFFAPGKDLHNGSWNIETSNSVEMIYGRKAFMANLQGIWGGGVFTGEYEGETFGQLTDPTARFLHLPMEGNYDESLNYLPETPGPGVGFGYDLKYKELHERQWDPSFNKDGDPNNEIRDFIRNLYPGSKFRFHRLKTANSSVLELIDDTVYTIKKVQIKKLYNHTSWRKPYNRYIDSTKNYNLDNGDQDEVYRSVEESAMLWLDTCKENDNGGDALSGIASPGFGDGGLIKKIEDFGASHNRRVCYIIELDKNPADSSSAMGNPLSGNFLLPDGTNALRDGLNADYYSDNFTDIEFLDPVQNHLLTDLSKFPAIWELDPKKQEVDLDIYYEASGHIPVKINNDTNELFAPIGCRVESIDSPTTSSSILLSWDNSTAILDPGFPIAAGGAEINYSGKSFKFIRQDGSYTVAEAGEQNLTGTTIGLKTEFIFREDIGEVISSGLAWNNCFSFGNGIESNRVRDDFNEPFITNGVKASTIIQETYQEERRKNGLIYSGIYNSNSGVNDLNQFVMAEKITKDLNPTYGSIQKLFSRNTDLVTFCEDKVVKVLANKDAVFNADGNPQLTANENVLGQTIPFVGEYGIATNPESFASESYRAYFTDKQRGAVLRLSRDGLTPISKAGMNDWFRDNLSQYHSLIGTYDSYKDGYNLTLSNLPEFSENFILDSYLDTGESLEEYTLGSLSIVSNPGISSGVSLQYLFESYKVNEYNSTNVFSWAPFNQASYDLTATVSVIHHAEIQAGTIRAQVDEIIPGTAGTYDFWTVVSTDPATGQTFTWTSQISAQDAENQVPSNHVGQEATNHLPAVFSNSLTSSGGTLPGQIWDATFNRASTSGSPNSKLFGMYSRGSHANSGSINYGSVLNGGGYADENIFGTVIRDNGDGQGAVDESAVGDGYNDGTYTNSSSRLMLTGSGSTQRMKWFFHTDDYDHNPIIEKKCDFPSQTKKYISNAVTRDMDTKNIIFDRCNQNAYIETSSQVGSQHNEGQSGTSKPAGELNYGVVSGATTLDYNPDHRKVFNGDEIHIEVHLKLYPTADDAIFGGLGYGADTFEIAKGYNVIEPRITIRDGNNEIAASGSTSPFWGAGFNQSTSWNQYTQSQNASQDSYRYIQSLQTESNWNGGTNDQYRELSNGDWETKTSNYNLYRKPKSTVYDLTNTGDAYEHWSWSSKSDCKTLILKKSVKFIDPSQQNSNGTRKGSSPYPNIETAVVVNDLRIRISQEAPEADPAYFSQSYQNNWSGYSHYGNSHTVIRPMWEISKVRIWKGYGVLQKSIGPTYSSITNTLTSATDPGGVHFVEKIPNVNVPAWTEVIHHNFGPGSWSYTGGAGFYASSRLSYKFGQSYSSTEITQYGANTSDLSQPPNDPIKYKVPNDWDSTTGDAPNVLNTSHNNYGSNGSAHQPAGIGAHGLSFNRVTDGEYYNTSSSPALVTFNEEFIHLAGSGSKDITYDITGNDEWEIDKWYLVDVEFDNTFGDGIPTNPGDPDLEVRYGNLGYPNAQVQVVGVGANYASSYFGWQPIDLENGVGRFTGAADFMHVGLIPTRRTEYGSSDGSGDDKIVLRGIFKVDSSSAVINGGPAYGGSNGKASNQFALRVYNAVNGGVRINKIIAKKLSHSFLSTWDSTAGTAEKWSFNDGIGSTNNITHMFSSKDIYFQRPGLCWQVPADKNDGQYFWSQEFGMANTLSPPVVSAKGWELRFTVDENPRTENFSGKLKGYIAIDDGSGGHEGLYFEDIQHKGNYLIKFNFDGDTSNYNPSAITPEPWVFLRGNIGDTPSVDYSTTGNFDIASSQTTGDFASSANVINKIKFSDGDALGTAQEYQVSNIQLTDSRKVFLGGSAGSWNFDQFNPSTNNYIYWKVGTNDFPRECLVFNNCPAVNFYGDKLGFVNANQQITKTINQFEQYKIKFKHSISENSDPNRPSLAIYYYNSKGFGFKISGIDHTTGVATGKFDLQGNEIREVGFDPLNPKIVTIGELDSIGQPVQGSTWSNVNEFDSTYEADLVNSFVVAVQGDMGQVINGTIDAITMQRAFTSSYVEDTTVTFAENVNGWTSFKSFTPENGLSLSKKYFTFDKGALYQHYVPKKGGSLGEYVDTVFVKYTSKEADNYNNFYNNQYVSSITAVLNQEPSIVKTFNTLNYEGTQAYILKPSTVYKDGLIVKSEGDLTNINNAITLGLSDLPGWSCEEIKTDLDAGTVSEFIKKEGKWFNFIKGKNNTNIPNTKLFSVQGVGFIDSIEVMSTQINPFFEINTTTTNGEPEIVVSTNTGNGGATSGGGTGTGGIGINLSGGGGGAGGGGY